MGAEIVPGRSVSARCTRSFSAGRARSKFPRTESSSLPSFSSAIGARAAREAAAAIRTGALGRRAAPAAARAAPSLRSARPVVQLERGRGRSAPPDRVLDAS